MSLENELSEEEMNQIRVSELSNIIVGAYDDAKKHIAVPDNASIKAKWEYAEINSKRYSYLIYLEKYNNRDKSVFNQLRNYLVSYLEAELEEKRGYQLIDLYSKKKKNDLLLYFAIPPVIFSAFMPMLAIPGILLGIIYSKRLLGLSKEANKAILGMAFQEATIEELREMKEIDLDAAIECSKERLK